MGWTGSADPLAQIELTFPDRDAALAYAWRQDLATQAPNGRMPAGR